MRRIETSADRLRTTIGRAFAFAGIGLGIRELVQLADAFTNTQNRLKTVTDSMAELNLVTSELFRVANSTRNSFQSTAETFTRVALAVRELGISQQQTVEFSESLNQAVILSGASAKEAQAGLIQLSQGLSSGALRGDELRSVLEQLPVVADVIAKSMGVVRGELRELGAEGKITAEIVLQAFKEAREELGVRFAETVPTIGQAFTVLRNNAIELQGEFDKATNISAILAEGIIALANNLEVLARTVLTAGIALGIHFAVRGVGAAIAAVNALTIAIAANPLGALAVATTVAVSALIAFSDEIAVSEDGLITLQDVGIATFQEIQDIAEQVAGFLGPVFQEALSEISLAFASLGLTYEDVLTGTKSFVNNYIGLYVGVGRVVSQIFDDIGESITENFGAFLRVGQLATKLLINSITDAFRRLVNGATIALRLLGIEVKSLGKELEIAFDIATLATELAIPDTVKRAGKRYQEAFLEGFNQDFVGGALDFLAPVFEAIGARANSIGDRARARANARRRQELIEAHQQNAASRLFGQAGAVRDTGPSDFDELIDRLRDEQSILSESRRERELQASVLKAEKSLKRELTVTEEELVRELLRGTQALQDQADILDEINGPLEDYEINLKALDALLKNGAISQKEFAAQVRDTRLELLETQNTVGAGAERAILKFQKDAEDVAGATERAFTAGFEGISDAIADFAVDSENTFGDLLDNIERQIVGFVTSQAVAQLLDVASLQLSGSDASSSSGGSGIISSIGGSIGGAIGEFFGGFKANGGGVNPNQFFGVNELGTETTTAPGFFFPIRPGRIEPANTNGSGSGGTSITQTFVINAQGSEVGVEQRIQFAIEKAKPQIFAETQRAIQGNIQQGGRTAKAFGRRSS